MNRVDLLDKLATVAPALAASDLIPVLSHLWFTGTHVMAFNDQIAISTPCKTEFTGAVPGTVLLNLLKSSRAKEAELLPQDGNLQVKAASSRLKLAMLPKDSFIFEMPKPNVKETLAVDMKRFVAGIDACMRSVGKDTSSPDTTGVTLTAGESSLSLYSTNNATVSHAAVKLARKAPFKERVILSASFCEELLALVKGKEQTHVEIYDDHALCVAGGTVLFGRLVESDKPLPFDEIMARHFPASAKKQLVPIPSKLKLILERATIIADAKGGMVRTAVTVKDGRMRFVTKSDRGEVIDSMQVGEQQPEVSVMLEARLLKVGYGHFDKMLVAADCCVMAGDGTLYMVAAVGG